MTLLLLLLCCAAFSGAFSLRSARSEQHRFCTLERNGSVSVMWQIFASLNHSLGLQDAHFLIFFISSWFLRNCVHYRAATASPPPPLLCLISYDWHCSVLFTMHHSVSVAASLTVCFCSAAGLKRMALQLRGQRCLVSRTERVMIGVPVLNKQESAVRDELQLY